jgi:hypothetical protein
VSATSSATVAVRHERRGYFGRRATISAAGNSSLRLGDRESALAGVGSVAPRLLPRCGLALPGRAALLRFIGCETLAAVSEAPLPVETRNVIEFDIGED